MACAGDAGSKRPEYRASSGRANNQSTGGHDMNRKPSIPMVDSARRRRTNPAKATIPNTRMSGSVYVIEVILPVWRIVR
jgi:hypothetical protein